MIPTLEEINIKLRPPRDGDGEARFRLGNDAEVFKMFGISSDNIPKISQDAASRWVQKIAEHPHAWIIEAEDALIGEIRLDRVDLHDRRASMAIGIFDRKLLGKGLGSEAILIVLTHAFHTLRLHRIGIRVISYNLRAIRAYKKCGFIVEGKERETAFVNGSWYDDVMMGLLETEFVPSITAQTASPPPRTAPPPP